MRKLVWVLLLLSSSAFAQTTIASDAFTYSNGVLDTVSGGNWAKSGASSPFNVATNALASTSAVAGEVWSGTGTFTATQFSQVTMSATGSTKYAGPIVRGTAGTTTSFYLFICGSTQCRLGKYVAGSFTDIKVLTNHGLSVPLTMRLEISGTTLTPLLNGSTPAGFSATYTDSSLSTGKPGVMSLAAATGVTMDDWTGGTPAVPVAATPAISPAAGAYFSQQSITMTCSTGSSSIYYTTDGSTPTTGSTLYSGSFSGASSGAQTIKALCTATGYDNSSVATNAYSIAPSNVQLATDDFSTYYHNELAFPQGTGGGATNGEFQFPLDSYWTGSKWIAVGAITGTIEPSAIRFLAPVGHQNCDGVSGAPCVTSGGGSGIIMAANTAVSYSADQFSKVQIKGLSTDRSGVCVRCSTNGTTNSGYSLVVIPGTGTAAVYLDKTVAGTPTNLCSSTGLTIANGSTVELRIAGSTLQPLVNSSAVSGCSATYTDTAITQGNPGLAAYGGGANNTGPYVYNWSGGDVGSTPVSNATPATNWSYATYTDAATTNTAYPWMKYQMLRSFYATSQTNGGNTGWGVMGSLHGHGTVIQNYQAPFGSTGQYQMWTITVNPWDDLLNNYFMALMTERWSPGYISPTGTSGAGSGSGCDQAGNIYCDDEVAYYPGIQPHNQLNRKFGRATNCAPGAGKSEYGCKPFMHITKVTPIPGDAIADTGSHTDNACGVSYNPVTNPYGCNKVRTVAGSTVTPQKGDQWFAQYVTNRIQVACKRFGDNATWQSAHAYSVNDLIVANGHLQIVATAGTSAGSSPTFGTTWDVANYHGTATTDGGVTWWYYGEPCPSKTDWSWVIDAPDTDLSGRMGFPSLWFGGTGDATDPDTQTPIVKDWQAGTSTSATACSLLSLCVSSVESNQWMRW